jgi:hypothetical protein
MIAELGWKGSHASPKSVRLVHLSILPNNFNPILQVEWREALRPAIQDLIAALNDANSDVRRAAVQSLTCFAEIGTSAPRSRYPLCLSVPR